MQKLVVAFALAFAFPFMVFSGEITPQSSRSKAAAKRVRPLLEKALSGMELRLGDPVFMRVFKESNELEMWILHRETKTYKHFKTYKIAYYSGKLGPKLKEGDRQAPEGFYHVSAKRMNPNSRYHLSFNLGYPNTYDQAHGRSGSFLMIHGSRVSIGCYAMTNQRIEEIYTLADAALQKGQPYFRVHCFPFRMTADRMNKAKGSPWLGFWQNLKEGYDAFEKTKVPPNVMVKEKRYTFV